MEKMKFSFRHVSNFKCFLTGMGYDFQVEYSFPPLIPGAPNECPLGWKYLPTLALPDGSHNYDEDTVYFHLPSLIDPNRTIYGVSCFKQIPVEVIINVIDGIYYQMKN